MVRYKKIAVILCLVSLSIAEDIKPSYEQTSIKIINSLKSDSVVICLVQGLVVQKILKKQSTGL